MKKQLLTITVVTLALTGILGIRAVRSHLITVRDEIRTGVRGATPAGYEVNRIKALITDMSRDILAYGDKIAEIEQTAASLREDAKTLETRIAGNRADLLTERNMLAQEGEVFTIRGAAYSRTQVEASAQARVAQIQRDQSTLDTKKQAIEHLKTAVRDGQARLQEAVTLRDAKMQELDVLAADLANAQLRNELEALSTPLRDGVLSTAKNELADSMKAFSHRVREAQHQVEATEQVSSEPALIVHGSDPRTGLIEQIDRVLAPPAPVKAPAPASPQAK